MTRNIRHRIPLLAGLLIIQLSFSALAQDQSQAQSIVKYSSNNSYSLVKGILTGWGTNQSSKTDLEKFLQEQGFTKLDEIRWILSDSQGSLLVGMLGTGYMLTYTPKKPVALAPQVFDMLSRRCSDISQENGDSINLLIRSESITGTYKKKHTFFENIAISLPDGLWLYSRMRVFVSD